MAHAKREIQQERVKIDDEIRQARAKYQDSYNHGSYKIQHRTDGSTSSTFVPDQAYINQCRSELEHLDGHVYHEAKLCEELVHSKLMQSTQAVNFFIQQSDRLKEQFRNYVINGRSFLDKSAQYIEQYKGNNLKV